MSLQNNLDKNASVFVKKCKSYSDDVYSKIAYLLDNVTDNGKIFENKSVAVKPNLLMKATPEKAVTTHPVIVENVIEYIKTKNAKSIILVESPGGPYSEATLKIIYKSTGMAEVCEKTKIDINYDTSFSNESFIDGKVCKNFDIISPIMQSDIIVDLCKLKTHSLTTMSGASKNLFGTIPGIHKFEMHTRYPEVNVFEEMILDLCLFHLSRVPVISLCDAVIGMEGNGPSGGTPQNYGILAASANPFSLDLFLSQFLKLENSVGIVNKAIERGLCPASLSELGIVGENAEELYFENVKLPDTKSLLILKNLSTGLGGKLAKIFEPKPFINNKKCVGCGTCVKSCPMKTIMIVSKNGARKAKINPEKCIKCFCCQELCEFKAVKIKSNLIFKIVK